MQKIFLLNFLFLPSILSFGQKLKTYSGVFNDGKATYTYYEDPITLERIKQGNFTYSQNLTNKAKGFSHELTQGSYLKNMPNGTWSYKINYKDFNKTTSSGLKYDGENIDVNYYVTGDINATTNYINGIPNGNWLYSAKLQSREIYYNQYTNQFRFSEFKPYCNDYVSINFKNGIATGNILYKTSSKKITGQFNAYGELDGHWTIIFNDDNIQEDCDFSNGILVKKIRREISTGYIEENFILPLDIIQLFNKNKSLKNIVDIIRDADYDLVYNNIFTNGVVNTKCSDVDFRFDNTLSGKFYEFKKNKVLENNSYYSSAIHSFSNGDFNEAYKNFNDCIKTDSYTHSLRKRDKDLINKYIDSCNYYLTLNDKTYKKYFELSRNYADTFLNEEFCINIDSIVFRGDFENIVRLGNNKSIRVNRDEKNIIVIFERTPTNFDTISAIYISHLKSIGYSYQTTKYKVRGGNYNPILDKYLNNERLNTNDIKIDYYTNGKIVIAFDENAIWINRTLN